MHPYYHKQSGRTYYYYKTISSEQLKKKIDRNHSILIIDLLDDEHYNNKHIIKSQNACLYEIAFLDKIKKIINETNPKKIIIYGMGGKTYETKEAYIRLSKAGYQNIYMYKGGLLEWEKLGYGLEGSLDKEEKLENTIKSIQNSKIKIDTSKSYIERTGKNILKKHIGTIQIKEGSITMKNGKPETGNIILDMNSIKDIDIQDDYWNKTLVNHLKSIDFFDVKNFPVSNFEITFSKPMKLKNEFYVHGKITIKGISKLIRIKTTMNHLDNGEFNMRTQFEINKVDFDIFYGSPKFFAALGKHFIHDKIGIEANLFFK